MSITLTTQAERDFLSDLVRAYQAGLGRAPDNAGLEYWYNVGKANGFNLIETTKGFLPPEVLMQSPGHFIDDLYHSVLGRDADLAGFNYWTSKLSSGEMTKQQVMLSFALSTEFKAATNQGVFAVVQQAELGQPIDSSHGLAGIPVYDYAPKPPVTVEVIKEVPVVVDHFINVPVPVPTAEAHAISFNADGTVSTLAQKVGGDFLSGTGNLSTGFAIVTDTTTNVEMALRPFHRQSAEDVNPIASGQNGTRGWAEYNLDAGHQDGDHGAPINVNRADASMHFSITGAPGFMTDGDTKFTLSFWKDTDPSAADHWQLLNKLTLVAQADGTQAWVDQANNVVIGDDPASTVAATNSMNAAFGYWLGTANTAPGRYMVSIDEVAVVGLPAGQSVAGVSAIVNLV